MCEKTQLAYKKSPVMLGKRKRISVSIESEDDELDELDSIQPDVIQLTRVRSNDQPEAGPSGVVRSDTDVSP